MRHYKDFHNELAKINDSIIFHTFCSEQINIKLADFIATYKGKKRIDKLSISDVFKKNKFARRFNKKVTEAPNQILKADSFIYDNSLILIYLQIEIFGRRYYQSLQKIEKKFKQKNFTLQLDSLKLTKSYSIEDLDQKLKKLKDHYKKNGIQLNTSKQTKEQLDPSGDSPVLIDINTNQIIKSILLNLGIFSSKSEDKHEMLEYWKTIISKKSIPLQLYLDTLEYFRLRRNAVAHRKLGDRDSGSFGVFIDEKGKYLNDEWNVLVKSTGKGSRHVNFESKTSLSFSSHLEVIESINVIRKIVDCLDYLFKNVYTDREFVVYYYWLFCEERSRKNKGQINLIQDFDRFYPKYLGYLESNYVKLDLDKEDVNNILIKIGE